MRPGHVHGTPMAALPPGATPVTSILPHDRAPRQPGYCRSALPKPREQRRHTTGRQTTMLAWRDPLPWRLRAARERAGRAARHRAADRATLTGA